MSDLVSCGPLLAPSYGLTDREDGFINIYAFVLQKNNIVGGFFLAVVTG